MLPERGLLPVLYEGLFLALASQLAAQGLQSTERGEFAPFTQRDVSSGNLIVRSFFSWLESLFPSPNLYLATDLGISKIS